MSTGESMVALRSATMDDAKTVFDWRNDPFIVERGSAQKTVSWDEHVRWFQATITGSERKMLIVLVDGVPMGQVRFDRIDERSCSISAYLLEKFTGRGLGVQAIRTGCDILFSQWQVAKIVACVREENAAARAGFRKAGFMETAETRQCPSGHFTLVLKRGICGYTEPGAL